MPEMGMDTFVRVRLTGGDGSYILAPVLTTTQRDALTGEEGMVIFNSTTDQLEEYDGSTWQAVGGGVTTFAELTDVTVVRKEADEAVNNSNILQNDDELLFAVGANEVWEVRVILLHDATSTAKLKVGFAAPTNSTVAWFTDCANSGGTVKSFGNLDLANTSFHSGENGSCIFLIDAIFTTGANAGNLQLKWSQFTATAEDTKVLANSCIIAHQLV